MRGPPKHDGRPGRGAQSISSSAATNINLIPTAFFRKRTARPIARVSQRRPGWREPI
jgi:hypothetical protein